MSQQDAGLYKSFALVLGALVLFTLLIIVIANIFSPSTDYSADPLIADTVKKQIEPVGRSNVREACLLYTSPSPRDGLLSRMPSSA